MNEHLEAAIKFSQDAANCFDRAGGDVSDRFAEQLRRDGNENIQLSQAAAAIAQAEAAQWQAQTGVRQALAAERQAAALERIAALLSSVISAKDDATERVINIYDLSPK